MHALNSKVSKLEEKINVLNSYDDIIERPEDDHSKNVCRIHAHIRKFDWCQPPNKSRGSSGTGTGFVIKDIVSDDSDTIYILTAHHVICSAIQIKVQFNETLDEIDAVIVGSNPAMDIAILKIQNETLKKNLNGFSVGNSDKLQKSQDVQALGFALGESHLQTTVESISGRVLTKVIRVCKQNCLM